MNIGRSLVWNVLKAWIRIKFPGVQQMAIAKLAQQLQQPGSSKPLLLDARTPEEFEVSHLPNAHRVERSMLTDPDQLPLAEDTTGAIVVYCSVGYRSAQFAQALQTLGYQNVFNLEGSLFEWVNQGYPVYHITTDGMEHETQAVHPYNATWGLLLEGKESGE
ncbi:rhodanese-like domain-containing protein [Oscillatoria sp. FACHB-1407]|uniref:rhodanese-like domain-containing protein n=1 Tax=Oscillatoria sp. FACHB-1407 TaxID=2692847 RepID=UPI00168920A9|nr:rhodanese-like domain-containing protein [Oscillatoria sp. FACHB-1407]MBD2461297.1 rhodanese-like domain-containing protein [Oscillatoria sp. FACHB-1407]